MAQASNPFLDAINSVQMPNINVNVPDFSSLFNPHGADLSSADYGSQPFNFSAAGFMPTSSSGSSIALPGALKTAAPQQPLWQRALGWLDRPRAAMSNVMYDVGQYMPKDTAVTPGNFGKLWNVVRTQHPYINPLGDIWRGLTGKESHSGSQLVQEMAPNAAKAHPHWASVAGTGTDIGIDPLSYLPVGGIAKAGAKAAHLADLSKPVIDALQHIPGANQIANAYQHVFKPIAGARSYFLHGVGKLSGKTESGANAIKNQLLDIFKGTSPEQRVALTHALESTAPGTKLNDSVLEGLRQKVEPLLERAKQHALDRGLISGELNPEEYGVSRYIPHVSTSKLDEEFQPFKDISQRSPNIDAAKSRGLAGTIKALNSGDKKMFEEDMSKILGYHLNQINKASALRDLIDEAMSHAIEPNSGKFKAVGLHEGDIFPGTVQKATQYSHDGKTVLLPESEARYLTNITAPKSSASRFLSGLYRGSVNGLNRMMFLTSPFIHVVNNLGTQSLLHEPGILADVPKYLKEALTGVKPGSKMDEALKAGALHLTSEIGHSTNASELSNQIAKALDGKQGGFRKAMRAYNDMTPNIEKAYRTAAYHRFLQKGMSPTDAVKQVRSIFGGNAAHDAASNFEKTARMFMPFFNWTKTAIGSNVKNALRNPAPYVEGARALNGYNKAVTGHPMSQNHNPLSIGLPWKDKNGNQEYWAPYAPPFDVAKLAKDIATNGIRGPLDFAQTRFNPLAKYASQVATAEQNPFASPLNKFNIDKYTELAKYGPQYNETGMAFGGKGQKAPAYLAQLLQDIPNPAGTATEAMNTSWRDFLLGQLLGGSVSAPNPLSAIKEQNYNNQLTKSQYKSFLKQFANQTQ